MQTRAFKNTLAVSAVLSIFLCAFATKPASAVVIFNFVATCNSCSLPLALPNSDVTGVMALADGSVSPGGSFLTTDIVSLALTFQTAESPDVFNTIDLGIGPPPGFIAPLGEPAGTFDLAGDSIQTMLVVDFAGQGFQVTFGVDAPSSSWTVVSGGQGTGTPTSFDIPPTDVPEPNASFLFLIAAAWIVGLTRRQRHLIRVCGA